MKTITHEGEKYGWVNLQYVIDELPILGWTSTKSVSRTLSEMEERGLIELVHRADEANRGSKIYARPTEIVYELRGDHRTKLSRGHDDHQTELSGGNPGPPDNNVRSDTHTSIYTHTSMGGASDEAPLDLEKSAEKEEQIDRLIAHFTARYNKWASKPRSFRASTPGNRKPIQDYFGLGCDFDDVRDIIDAAFDTFPGTKYEKKLYNLPLLLHKNSAPYRLKMLEEFRRQKRLNDGLSVTTSADYDNIIEMKRRIREAQ